MKKLFATVIAFLMLFIAPSQFAKLYAHAEEISFEVAFEQFNSDVNVLKGAMALGGISNTNYLEYEQVSARAFASGELLQEADWSIYPEKQKLNFNSDLNVARTAYCQVVKIKTEALYKPENYADSENGRVLLTSLKNEVIAATNTIGVSKQTIDEKFSAYVEKINSGELATNVSVLSTAEESTVKGSVQRVDGALRFSSEDVLTIQNYDRKAYIKNINNALKDNENLKITNGGVGYYLQLKWVKNGESGIIQDNEEIEHVVVIEVEGLDLSLEDGDKVQIATYKLNGVVELSNEIAVENGKIVFNVPKLGEYAIIVEGYGNDVNSGIVGFLAKNWPYIVLSVIAILLVVLPICYSRRQKKKQNKKIKKKLKKYRKQLKSGKNKKNKS